MYRLSLGAATRLTIFSGTMPAVPPKHGRVAQLAEQLTLNQ
jgi:hypothetical protein